jgi:putative oxidoreductase
MTTNPTTQTPSDRTVPFSGALSGALRALVRTDADLGPLVLRLTLALVMFPHGAQKMLGWFGGYGFSGSMQGLTTQAGLPAVIAFLVICIEFFAPIGLLAGLLSRVAALGIGSVMVGAIFVGHLQFGFFMNWSGNQAGEGFEYHLLVIGIAVALLIQGSGALSVDRLLGREER